MSSCIPCITYTHPKVFLRSGQACTVRPGVAREFRNDQCQMSPNQMLPAQMLPCQMQFTRTCSMTSLEHVLFPKHLRTLGGGIQHDVVVGHWVQEVPLLRSRRGGRSKVKESSQGGMVDNGQRCLSVDVRRVRPNSEPGIFGNSAGPGAE